MLRLVGEWRVDVRTHTPAPDDAPAGDGTAVPGDEAPRTASLTFEGDGQVFGTGGVNRLRGTWSVEDGTLTFGPVVSTLMAGPEPAMRREAELLRLLREPLELRTDEGAAAGVLEPLAARPGDADAAPDRLELVAPSGEGLTLTRVDA